MMLHSAQGRHASSGGVFGRGAIHACSCAKSRRVSLLHARNSAGRPLPAHRAPQLPAPVRAALLLPPLAAVASRLRPRAGAVAGRAGGRGVAGRRGGAAARACLRASRCLRPARLLAAGVGGCAGAANLLPLRSLCTRRLHLAWQTEPRPWPLSGARPAPTRMHAHTQLVKTLGVSEDVECVVVGTLFKQQRLRPSILDEYTKDGALKQVRPLGWAGCVCVLVWVGVWVGRWGCGDVCVCACGWVAVWGCGGVGVWGCGVVCWCVGAWVAGAWSFGGRAGAGAHGRVGAAASPPPSSHPCRSRARAAPSPRARRWG